jgi:hypothetical protein
MEKAKMKETIDFMELILTILPFIFGVVALALIPSKKKLSEESTSFKVELLILVYLIALLILMLGIYYFIPAFGDNPGDNLVNIINGLFMSVIGLGIMVVNYKNYSFYSESHLDLTADGRTTVTDSEVYPHSDDLVDVETVNVETVDTTKRITAPKKAKTITRPEPELLECPQCSNTITITATKRPLKIKCPHCGVEGIIR